MNGKIARLLTLVMVLAMIASPAFASPLDLPVESTAQPPAANPEAAPVFQAADAAGPALYIVQLQDASLASYTGGIAGLRATSPEATGASKLNPTSPASRAYLNYLEGQQADAIDSISALLGRSVDVTFQYLAVLNAFAVTLSPEEAAVVAKLPEIKAVWRDVEREMDTDEGPIHIGAPQIWNGNTGTGAATRGEGAVIGVIDSGINHAHPSFAATDGGGYTHTNPYGAGVYKGWCVANPSFCNSKLIAAYGFNPNGGSPEDLDGHGSHTASTSGGNAHTASFNIGPTPYNIPLSGVAPRANIVAYKVCNPSCPGTASVAAVNSAILNDGVDVLNYSISGSDSPWNDPVDLAFLDASNAGIFVSASAGNSGPGASTVAKTGPWNAAVAASTINRVIANTVDVTGPTTPAALQGMAAVPGENTSIVANVTGSIKFNAANSNGCAAFSAGYFTNSLALIQRGTCDFATKVNNAAAAGATGVVVFNNVGGPPISMGLLTGTPPAFMLDLEDGTALRDYIVANPTATARVNVATSLIVNNDWEDIVAGFSSRGPSQFELVKPDYIAPGVNILAAVAAPAAGSPATYAFYQGTSMSSPHGAGAAALMMDLYPSWTPAEIKSAMASAAIGGLVKENGTTPADPFDVGSGLLALGGAANVGLVFNETGANYAAANPAIGGDPKTLNQPSMANYNCGGTCSWTRTVKAVEDGTWSAVGSAPGDATITVTPNNFTLNADDTQVLTITFNAGSLPLNQWAFGSVTLTPSVVEGAPMVVAQTLPVVVKPTSSIPDINVTPASLAATQAPNTTTSQALNIANVGTAPLTWQIAEAPATVHLPTGVSRGVEQASASQQVTIGDASFARSTLTPGQVVTPQRSDTPDALVTITHSASQSIVTGNSVSCNAGGLHADNSYLRQFDLTAFGITDAFNVTEVEIGVEQAVGAGGSQPLTVNLYTKINPAGALTWANLSQIGTASTTVTDQALTVLSVPVTGAAPAGSVLVVEVFTPNGQTAGHSFFVGSNAAGQTAPSYLAAAECGVVEPTDTAAIGFPTMHIVMNVTGDTTAGPATCDNPADVPWLTVAPTGGTTNAGANSNVTVGFDSTGLAVGAYNAVLCVTSNDPQTPLVEVPVTLTVEEQGGNVVEICRTPNVPIPDNSTAGPGSVSDTITVPDALTILDFDVYVRATHTWVGDLAFSLQHVETATTAALINRPGFPTSTFGCSGDNYDVTVNDEGPDTPIENQCGAAAPTITGDAPGGDPPGPVLAAFDGQSTQGNWVLTATDNATGDTGTLVEWCVRVTVPAGGDPNIDVDPLSMASTQAPNTTTNQTLDVANTGGADLTWNIFEEDTAAPELADWSDNFDSYATGSQLHSQGGWKGWFNDPAAGALASSDQARSAPNSAAILGASDLVHEYGETDGQWVYTAWQYVPTNFTGQSYFIMLNSYDDAGSNLNWSAQVMFDGGTNLVTNDGGVSGGSAALVKGQWVELRFEIDLDADTGAFYYNNQLLYSGTWSGQVSGGGATTIAAVDLFANTASVVYYDDMSLVAVGGPTVCSAPSDIPWASVAPANGTTAPGATTGVNVTFDSTGLALGTYTGNLCVESNDPDAGPGNETELVIVPLRLQVEGQAPNIDVDPLSMSSTQPANTTTQQMLNVANTGGGTLDWQIDEENITAFPTIVQGPLVAQPAAEVVGAPEGAAPAAAPSPATLWQAPDAILYDNGPLVTNPGAGFGGADASALQSALGLSIYGFGHAVSSGFRVADDFTVPAGPGWMVDSITFFAYQTGSTTTSTIDAVNLRIWDGPPGQGGSTIVFGDTTTNRLSNTAFTNAYRVLDTGLTGNTRPIMADTATVNTYLAPGTYWVDWQTGGTLASGPWAPPVSILGQTAKPGSNGVQFDGAAWNPLLDTGAQTVQDLPFIVEGTAGAADCVMLADIPWLSLGATAGSNAGGTNTDVAVTFDSTGLANGTYTGNLCVTSNDPDAGPGNGTELVVVPVELIVEEGQPGAFVCNAPAEGFENGVPPAGWSIQTNEPNGPQWSTIAGCGETGNFTNGTGEAACVSSDIFGAAEMDTSLVTPMFSLAGFGAASLSYTANYQNFANLDFLNVDISADGGATWTTLLSWNEDHGGFRAQPGENVSIDLSAYAGQSGLMLRYRYFDPNTGDFNWYAQVDNAALTCGQAGEEPNIDVDPLSMTSTQPTNTTTQQTLDVGNTGTADLTWMIEEEPVQVVEAPAAPNAGPSKLSAPAAVERSAKELQDLLNSATADVVQDGSFEAGTPNPFWNESSTNFGTPLCDPGCGLGGGTGPLTGSWWAWFGGIAAYEAGNVSQSVTIPSGGPATLSFWVEQPVCSGDPADYLDVLIDGTTLWSTNGAAAECGVIGYRQVTVDVSAYANGGAHLLEFNSEVFGSDTTNFFVDDVMLDAGAAPVCDAPSDVPWLSVNPTNGTTAPAAITPVDVTFDSTGLAAGTYNANLCVTSNDPDPGPGNETELVIVPVELVVTEPSTPAIEIVKTVGTDPGVCGTESSITVPAGTEVYYCYTVTNTGDVTLNLHDLVDDQLGTLFTGFAYALTPGSSVSTVDAGLTISAIINAPTLNIATWTAYNAGAGSAMATATAFVDVIYFSCQNPIEGFEAGVPPLGWTLVNNVAGGPTWGDIASCGPNGSGGNWTNGLGDAACISASTLEPGAYDAELRSPVFSLVGYSNSTLSFLMNYQNWGGIDRLDFDISTDGGLTWAALRTYTTDQGAFQNTPGVYITTDLAPYLGQSNLMLRWRYHWDTPNALGWYAQIDDAEFKCVQIPPTAVTLDSLRATPAAAAGSLSLLALPAVVSVALGAAYALRRRQD